jgi:hypothetical protein
MRHHGEVMRLLPHGIYVFWDYDEQVSFPYYGRCRFDVGDKVTFNLNEARTVAVEPRCLDQSK